MLFRDPRELSDHIKAGAPLPVYLLYGEESSRIEACTAKMQALADPSELYRYDGRALPPMDTVADCALSLSFFAGRRCVVLDDLDPAALSAPDWDKLCELLEAPEPNTLLLISSRTAGMGVGRRETGARPRKLIELCDKAGGVCRFDRMTAADAAKYASAIASRAGRVLERSEAQLLTEYCGGDAIRIAREMEKLLAYRTAGQITRQDIELLVSPAVEANVFRLSELLLSRDFDRAMALIDDLIFLREQPAAILSMISMAYADLDKASEASRAGKSMAESAKAYGMAGNYRYEKAWGSASRLRPERLGRALEILADAELAVKSGGGDPRTALETAVARLTVL